MTLPKGLLVLTTAAAVLATGASAAVGPNLSGERLVAGTALGVGVFEVTVDCRPDAASTVTFHAEGVALGPYPGTFVEDGRATQEQPGLGREGFTGGRLLSFEAEFTIFAEDGSVVVGTKQLDPASSEALTGLGSEGNCIGDQERHLADLHANTLYTATVQRPDGATLEDHGTSRVDAQSNTQGFVPDVQVFEESFASLAVLPPTTTPGQVTGGGRVGDTTFALVARSDGSSTEGACNVVDEATDAHVKCLTVESFVVAGPEATITGLADVDGVQTTYRLVVVDACRSGAGCDSFALETDSGFAVAGTLASGNVQVRG
jgi:hypothetical protein